MSENPGTNPGTNSEIVPSTPNHDQTKRARFSNTGNAVENDITLPTENASSLPKENNLIALLDYAQEMTNELNVSLNSLLKTKIELVLLPFFIPKTVVNGGGRLRRKKRGGTRDEDVDSFAMVCVNMYDNPVFVGDEINDTKEKVAKSALDAIVTHKDLLDDVCNQANKLLQSAELLYDFQTKCDERLNSRLTLPGQVVSQGDTQSNNSVKVSTDISANVIFIGSAMLDLVAHINRTNAKNFNDTNVIIELDDGSKITFTIKLDKEKYKLFFKIGTSDSDTDTEITHFNMIPFLKNSVKTEIVNIETTVYKIAKAKVALKKLDNISASYYDYLAKKGGVQHVEKFVTVRNIHFVYRQKTETEREKAELEGQLLINAAAEKARVAAEKARVAAANAAERKSIVEGEVKEAMANFAKGLNTEDKFYLFNVARQMMDPSKMEPFLKAL